MKSVKPGRGPSFMGGVGGIGGCAFAVIWTVMAFKMGAPLPFCFFGVIFFCIALANTIYNFHNAKSKNRFSSFDIVDHNEEPDILNEKFGNHNSFHSTDTSSGSRFCPYCGAAVEGDFEFCNKCGKRLPD